MRTYKPFYLRHLGHTGHLAAAALALILAALPTKGANLIWSGSGGDEQVLDAGNWQQDQTPGSGAQVTFTGSNSLNPLLSGSLTLQSITFDKNASAFTLGGSGTYTLGSNGLSNQSFNLQTINNALILSSNQSWATQNAGLTINGAVNLGSSQVRLSGTGGFLFQGNISGAGSLSQNGGELTLTGSNSFTGGIALSGGTLVIGNDSALGTGILAINSAEVDATDGPETVSNPVSLTGNINFLGSNNLIVSGSASLSGNLGLTVGGTGSLIFLGDFTQNGSPSLTEAGSGTLELLGTNTFGSFTLDGGTIIAGNGSSLGSNTLTIAGGTVEAENPGGLTFANPLSLSGNPGFAGPGPLTFTGSVSFSGTTTTTINGTNVTLNGAISQSGGNAAFVTVGSGSLTLAGTAASNFTSPTFVNSGTLILDKSAGASAIGGSLTIGDNNGSAASAVVLLDGTGQLPATTPVTINSDGRFNLQSFSQTVGALTFNGGSIIGTGTLGLAGNITADGPSAGSAVISAPIALSGSHTIILNDNSGAAVPDLTISSVISDGTAAGAITVTGTGVIALNGLNTFSGGATLSSGIITAGNGSAFGTGTLSMGNATLESGGSPVSFSNPTSFSGNPTFSGTSNLSFMGAAMLNGSCTFSVNNPVVTIGGAISGTGSLIKSGNGTLTLTNSSPFSGAVVLNSGQLTLSGSSGTLASASSFSIGTGATLTLDNSAGTNTNRIANTAAILLDGGTFSLASGSAGSTETVGALDALGGNSTVSVSAAGAGSALTFSSLGGIAGGASITFSASGGTLGSGPNGPQIYISGQLLGLMGNWATVGGGFASYGVYGVQALSSYFTGSSGINLNDPTQVVSLSGSSPSGATTLTNPGTTYDGGLYLTGSPAIALGTSSSQVLDLVSGGLIAGGTSTISGLGRLTSSGTSAGPLVASVSPGGILTISSIIADNSLSGVVSLEKANAGALILGGSNTFSGNVSINGGTLSISSESNLGALSKSVILNSGTLSISAGFAASTGKVFTIGAGLAGTIDVTSGQTLTLANASNVLTTGNAASLLYKTDAGALVIQNADTAFTGTLELNGGMVEIQNALSLGSGAIVLGGGTLGLATSNNTTFNNPISLLANSAIDVEHLGSGGSISLSVGTIASGANTLTITSTSGVSLTTGTVNMTGATTFNTASANLTIGVVTGPFGFAKSGTDTLTLTGSDTNTGPVAVQSGTLSISNVATGAAPQALGEDTGADSVTLGVPNTASGVLAYTGGSATLDKNITALGTGGDVINNAGNGVLTLSGTLKINGVSLTLNTGLHNIAVSGPIVGGAAGGSNLLITGGATATLTGSSTYGGATSVIGSSTLVIGTAGAIPSSTALALGESVGNTSGILDLDGNNQTLAQLNSFGSGNSNSVTNNGSSAATLTIANGGTFAGSIKNGGGSGVVSLTVTGGTFNLAGTSNNYTGATNVNGGTLIVSGAISGSGPVVVGPAATLASGDNLTSKVGGALTVYGTLAPGGVGTGGVGTLTTGALTLGSSGTTASLDLAIGGTAAGTGYDQLSVSTGSSLNLTNVNLVGSLINNFTPVWATLNSTTNQYNQNGSFFFLIIGQGSVTGQFANQQPADPKLPGFGTISFGGQEFAISYTASTNGGGSLTGGADVALMAIPEPNLLGLLATSLGLQLAFRRFRNPRPRSRQSPS